MDVLIKFLCSIFLLSLITQATHCFPHETNKESVFRESRVENNKTLMKSFNESSKSESIEVKPIDDNLSHSSHVESNESVTKSSKSELAEVKSNKKVVETVKDLPKSDLTTIESLDDKDPVEIEKLLKMLKKWNAYELSSFDRTSDDAVTRQKLIANQQNLLRPLLTKVSQHKSADIKSKSNRVLSHSVESNKTSTESLSESSKSESTEVKPIDGNHSHASHIESNESVSKLSKSESAETKTNKKLSEFAENLHSNENNHIKHDDNIFAYAENPTKSSNDVLSYINRGKTELSKHESSEVQSHNNDDTQSHKSQVETEKKLMKLLMELSKYSSTEVKHVGDDNLSHQGNNIISQLLKQVLNYSSTDVKTVRNDVLSNIRPAKTKQTLTKISAEYPKYEFTSIKHVGGNNKVSQELAAESNKQLLELLAQLYTSSDIKFTQDNIGSHESAANNKNLIDIVQKLTKYESNNSAQKGEHKLSHTSPTKTNKKLLDIVTELPEQGLSSVLSGIHPVGKIVQELSSDVKSTDDHVESHKSSVKTNKKTIKIVEDMPKYELTNIRRLGDNRLSHVKLVGNNKKLLELLAELSKSTVVESEGDRISSHQAKNKFIETVEESPKFELTSVQHVGGDKLSYINLVKNNKILIDLLSELCKSTNKQIKETVEELPNLEITNADHAAGDKLSYISLVKKNEKLIELLAKLSKSTIVKSEGNDLLSQQINTELKGTLEESPKLELTGLNHVGGDKLSYINLVKNNHKLMELLAELSKSTYVKSEKKDVLSQQINKKVKQTVKESPNLEITGINHVGGDKLSYINLVKNNHKLMELLAELSKSTHVKSEKKDVLSQQINKKVKETVKESPNLEITGVNHVGGDKLSYINLVKNNHQFMELLAKLSKSTFVKSEDSNVLSQQTNKKIKETVKESPSLEITGINHVGGDKLSYINLVKNNHKLMELLAELSKSNLVKSEENNILSQQTNKQVKQTLKESPNLELTGVNHVGGDKLSYINLVKNNHKLMELLVELSKSTHVKSERNDVLSQQTNKKVKETVEESPHFELTGVKHVGGDKLSYINLVKNNHKLKELLTELSKSIAVKSKKTDVLSQQTNEKLRGSLEESPKVELTSVNHEGGDKLSYINLVKNNNKLMELLAKLSKSTVVKSEENDVLSQQSNKKVTGIAHRFGDGRVSVNNPVGNNENLINLLAELSQNGRITNEKFLEIVKDLPKHESAELKPIGKDELAYQNPLEANLAYKDLVELLSRYK